MKIKTLYTMNYKWAIRFLNKRFWQHVGYYQSKLQGRQYWINPYGVKLGFLTPYHHSIAHAHTIDNHEPEVIRRWAELSKSASLIYDIGGYNGVFGLVSAKVNPKAHVVIFEPDKINYDQIVKNVALNGFTNCEAKQVAITNYNGTIEFQMDGTSGARIGKGTAVECARLDALPKADLIKIDVEGEEGRVVEGADFSYGPTLILEHHNWLKEPEKMWQRLASFGYTPNIFNREKDGPHHLLKPLNRGVSRTAA